MGRVRRGHFNMLRRNKEKNYRCDSIGLFVTVLTVTLVSTLIVGRRKQHCCWLRLRANADEKEKELY